MATRPRKTRWSRSKRGVAFIKANPRDKGYADVSNKAGQFIDRDLYRVV